MKKAYVLLILILCGAGNIFAQKKPPSNPFGLEMNEPVGWHPIGKDLIDESLRRIDLNETSLEQFLEQNQDQSLLFAYTKFKQDSFTGINPKIEARVLRIHSSKPIGFLEFKPLAEATLRKIASGFDEQRYLKEPSEIKIGGIDSVYHISEFLMRTQNGTEYKVRSRTYMIPRGTYFFQISFVDEPKKNDLSSEFDDLVGSIKILK
jgi:hypothetical protein